MTETDTTQRTPQSGALDAPGLRRVVGVLSTVQIVSWGFSVCQLVSGGVGIWVGRHLDAYSYQAR